MAGALGVLEIHVILGPSLYVIRMYDLCVTMRRRRRVGRVTYINP